MSKIVQEASTELGQSDIAARLARLERELKLALPKAGSDIKATLNPIAGLTGEQEIEPNWLLLNGASLSTTKWPELFAAWGYFYGGSGASFSLPDARGRSLFGRSTSGSLATAGASGGAETTTLTAAQIPAHTHTISNYTHNHGAASGNFMQTNGTSTGGASGGGFTTFIGQSQAGSTANDLGHSHGGATGSYGTGGSHTNLPPYLVVEGWLVYAGLKQA